jgi:hypothetical protein
MAAKSESWTVNYIPEGRGRVLGTLTVDASGVNFDTGDPAEEIVLPREQISRAEAARKRLMKRVVITTTDGRSLTFEYGLLSVARIVDAINAGG